MVWRYHIEGGDFVNAGKASSAVKSKLKQLNIPASRIKRLVVALYESEVNVVAHAREGDIEVQIESDRITVTVTDRGPGIADLDKAMEEGFSTASREVREMGFGAGMGLPNIKRNSDQLDIDTVPGEGTMVRITNTLKD
jgi:anti-sigma regulatory factor (Ser/Thr protein kinase)